MSEIRGRDYTLTIETELLEWTPTEVPDPKWVHTDSAGHEHRWVGDEVPTVETVKVGEYRCDSCCDMHTVTETRCKLCGEQVSVGTKAPAGQEYREGSRTVLGTVAPTHKHYKALYEAGFNMTELDAFEIEPSLFVQGVKVLAWGDDGAEFVAGGIRRVPLDMETDDE